VRAILEEHKGRPKGRSSEEVPKKRKTYFSERIRQKEERQLIKKGCPREGKGEEKGRVFCSSWRRIPGENGLFVSKRFGDPRKTPSFQRRRGKTCRRPSPPLLSGGAKRESGKTSRRDKRFEYFFYLR